MDGKEKAKIIADGIINDRSNFIECFLENESKADEPSWSKMLREIAYEDKSHFDKLSEGCKAAMLLTLELEDMTHNG